MPISRRSFLTHAVTGAGATAVLGPAFWARVWAAPAQPGPGPYGPLAATPDANGVLLPDGFTSRIVAHGARPVGTTGFVMPVFPDGGCCFPSADRGWTLVLNSETPEQVPGAGGASAIRFAADGSIVDAYRVLGGTSTNCAGGATPWGTWLSCEETASGRVWECDPTGATPARVLPGLGTFKHEAAAVDPGRGHVYLTEDQSDGRFYRFTPAAWPDLARGTLEAAEVSAGGAVTWHVIPDPSGTTAATRLQVPATTAFRGGEGCFYDEGIVYITTKGDDRVWTYDVATATMSVLYDGGEHATPVLKGVDNILVAPTSGDVYVAEDGDNMEVVLLSEEQTVSPFARLPGPEHGFVFPGAPYQPRSEVTGLAFSPDGTRLYFSSQRGFVWGIVYEVTGPFRTTTATTPAAATIAGATRRRVLA